MPAPERYELPLAIRPDDIDELGHVNNVVYVRWIQDAAVAHWQARASRQDREARVWVVTRHEIDYKGPALPEDRLVARTWVGKASRLTFQRHTEIVRLPEEETLVRARSVWVPLDPGTMRPAAVRDEVRERFSTGEGPR